jgi:hypothetical protein
VIPIRGLPARSTPARRICDQRLADCGESRCGALCNIGILPGSDETKGAAGWKPALWPAPKEFFRSLLVKRLPNRLIYPPEPEHVAVYIKRLNLKDDFFESLVR